ncbi:MAG: flavin reductase family protein [Rubrobacteraceae bacterium]|nr:flavin reductase family protein [Rubrobacteraceae bacterium]MCL6438000.1 flavin reductase family protein [Rubrobacteraceae bacterium]
MEQRTQTQTRIDPREFRRALGRFASGITVITTVHEGHVHGMTANAFVSVSLDPPLVLISVDNRTYMNQLLPKSGRYGISILSDEQEDISQHFAGRPKEGLEIPFVERHGIPLLEGALAHLVCEVVDIHPAGDHTLYIGRVEYLDYSNGAPLLFYTGAYRCLEVQLWDHSYIW